jgi:DNA-binding LytR/AlgR family response regulator
MNIIIIEDEHLAIKRLSELIKKYNPEINILAKIQSVKKAVEWFSKNPEPDLAFMDIQLGDGLSFDIFEQIKITCPVIFTTAYDEYALKAFKVNSIDYLLKPFDFEELAEAINKFNNRTGASRKNNSTQNIQIEQVINMLSKKYKERFTVKIGEHIKLVPVADILCFYSREKASYIFTKEKRNYFLDFSLDKLETLINPNIFFRVNRKFIINIHAVKDIIAYSNSRLKVNIQDFTEDEIIVSREKVSKFKEWLEQ